MATSAPIFSMLFKATLFIFVINFEVLKELIRMLIVIFISNSWRDAYLDMREILGSSFTNRKFGAGFSLFVIERKYLDLPLFF